jgi:uncharacterized protein
MRILVFGASGRTGLRVVRAAVERDLAVAAFVRDPGRVTGVELHVGDVSRQEDVAAAVRADDVVVSCLGGGGIGAGTANIVAAMQRVGARRIVAVVGAGVLQHDDKTLRNEQPDYPPPLRAIGKEHQAVFDALRTSSLAWSLVCTPRLVDGEATGRMIVQRDYLPAGSFSVTTGDVAALLVGEAVSGEGRGRLGVNG